MDVRVWVQEGLIGVFALGVARVAWLALHPPRPVRLIPDVVVEGRRRTVGGIQQGWLALTGLPLTPMNVRHIGWAVGGLAAVLLSLVTHNPVVGSAFGLVGLIMPEAIIRVVSRRQWRRLDMAAYGATHMLQAKLELGVPVLEAFRALFEDANEPFRTWVEPCLTRETQGTPLEVTLKERAEPIQHVELAALADVLAVERASGLTAPIVARTVTLWSHRIRADAVRRGTIAATTTLGYAIVGGGLAIFWVLWASNPAFHEGVTHGVGFWTTGVGTWILAGVGWIQNAVSRRAEAGGS